MIIFTTKTNCIPINLNFWSSYSWLYKMWNYDCNLFNSLKEQEQKEKFASDVYYTYGTIVKFNNTLEKDYKEAFKILNDFLIHHEDIHNSVDYKCKNYYDKMKYWKNKYLENPNDETIKIIIDDVQNLLLFLERKKIVKKSGCNLKRNYYEKTI